MTKLALLACGFDAGGPCPVSDLDCKYAWPNVARVESLPIGACTNTLCCRGSAVKACCTGNGWVYTTLIC